METPIIVLIINLLKVFVYILNSRVALNHIINGCVFRFYTVSKKPYFFFLTLVANARTLASALNLIFNPDRFRPLTVDVGSNVSAIIGISCPGFIEIQPLITNYKNLIFFCLKELYTRR